MIAADSGPRRGGDGPPDAGDAGPRRVAEAALDCGSGSYLAIVEEESGGATRIRVERRGPASAYGPAGARSARVAGVAGSGSTLDPGEAEALLGDARLWASLGSWAGGASNAFEDRLRRRLSDLVQEIAYELESGRPDSQALASAYALEFVVLAARARRVAPEGRAAPETRVAPGGREPHDRRPDSRADGVWTIDDAIAHIDAAFADSFSLEWFVSKCAMNVTDFSRRFKEKAGCPLFEYINRRRIRRACQLLKSTDLSVIEIAYSVGYNNLSFFNRYFHRVTGGSPKEYRRASAR